MEKLTTSYLRLFAKFKKRTHIIDFASVLCTAKSFLIFMPDAANDFEIAKKFVEKLKQSYPAAHFVLFTKKDFESAISAQKQHGTIFVTPEDINTFGLPKKNIQHRIMATDFDIVIDLNSDFNLISTFLCQKSSATLKICLDNRLREPFYNFYYRNNLKEEMDTKYRKFFSYIDNCTHHHKIADRN